MYLVKGQLGSRELPVVSPAQRNNMPRLYQVRLQKILEAYGVIGSS